MLYSSRLARSLAKTDSARQWELLVAAGGRAIESPNGAANRCLVMKS
jgi:hypothetical protein